MCAGPSRLVLRWPSEKTSEGSSLFSPKNTHNNLIIFDISRKQGYDINP